MKISHFLAFALLILQPLFVSADEASTCVESLTAPVIDVADFDASGLVDSKDIEILRDYMRNKNSFKSKANRENNHHKSNHRSRHNATEVVYSPLLDRNNDGKINGVDMYRATRDIGETSTPEQQELARINNEFLAGTYVCVAETDAEKLEAERLAAEKLAAEKLLEDAGTCTYEIAALC